MFSGAHHPPSIDRRSWIRSVLSLRFAIGSPCLVSDWPLVWVYATVLLDLELFVADLAQAVFVTM